MKVRCYGVLGEMIGREVDLPSAPAPAPAPATVAALRDLLARLYPHAAAELARPAVRACIGEQIVPDDHPLAGAAEVELFPPLSGG